MIGLGNGGGLLASNIFFTDEAPYYATGMFKDEKEGSEKRIS